MFRKAPNGVYQSTLLELPWIRHGFATKNSDGFPGDYTFVKQIHSDIVTVADERAGCLGQGDALLTHTPDRWIGVRTADCVPILLVQLETRAVAAVHAGWRGTVAGIAARAVERLTGQYGGRPEDILAAIGPCIAECCFEVGPEVAQQFDAILPERTRERHVDLVAVNQRQLLGAGVRTVNIDAAGVCTVCCAGEFHSYRRDRELAGRMVAAISTTEEQ